MNLLIPKAASWIVPLLFVYKDGFDVKYIMGVDMPLNKEEDGVTNEIQALKHW